MAQPPNHDDYSNQAAAEAFTIARMTQTFDRTLSKTKDHDAADIAVRENTSGINASHYNFITVNSTTALLVYDPVDHKATVSFDPTHSVGDRWDAFQRGPEDHPIGGHVHGGVYEDMVSDLKSPGMGGDTMREVIEGILHDNATHNDSRALTVDFAGFSMGGAKSVIMAGELIANGLFDHENMEMGDIHAFGPPSYGDPDFTQALEQRVEELGGNIWMVQLHGDNMPDVLSPEGRGFAKYKYDQAGETVYLVPASNGSDAQILISPTDEEIEALPPADGDVDAHSAEAYKITLDQLADVERAPVASPAPTEAPSAPNNGFKP